MADTVALLAEGVDRNVLWSWFSYVNFTVALLAEGVDRNISVIHPVERFGVALLAEGVDRNIMVTAIRLFDVVALLAEGVDRNDDPAVAKAYMACRPPRGGRG